MTLENRTVVITGASGGLGSQLAADLGRAGANLALLERDPGKLADARAVAWPARWARLHPHRSTCSTRRPPASAAEAVLAHYGHVDVLIHVVGGWIGRQDGCGDPLRRPGLDAQPARVDHVQRCCKPSSPTSSPTAGAASSWSARPPPPARAPRAAPTRPARPGKRRCFSPSRRNSRAQA